MINNGRQFRIVVLLTYFIAMLLLIFYGKNFYPAITLEMCLNQPERYDGSQIDIGTEITVDKIYQDGFTIKQFGHIVKVKGRAENMEPGDFITLSVVFHKDGWLELKSYHIAKKRRFKIAVSIFPALLVIYLLLKSFSFDFKRFVFEERH
ncbi:hypothetical protein JXQ31_01895 [candidate division KSB1 bacterium]|nr:hypothetical protein [candidate division KSB1 bacterium]